MLSKILVRTIFYSFIILSSAVIILLCLEIFVRWQGRYGINGIQYSSTEIWRWRKFLSDKITNEEGETFICHTDRFGFRNYGKKTKKPEDVIRILVLGDSYTEGLSYADDKIFTGLLEKSLSGVKKNGKRIEVIGASSPAWSTEQELRCLQNEAPCFEPDYVLLMACPNDIREAYCKKFAELNDDGSIRFNPINYKTSEIIRWRLSNYSHFYQYLQHKVFYTDYGSFANLMGHYSFNFGKEDSASWDRPVFLKKSFPELDKARKLFYSLINEMQKTCKEKNIHFAVSLIPMIQEFNNTMKEDTTMQSGIVSDSLKGYCNSSGIGYIDLYNRFKNDADPTSHFLKSDFHFNGKGHRVTAEGLAAYYQGVLK